MVAHPDITRSSNVNFEAVVLEKGVFGKSTQASRLRSNLNFGNRSGSLSILDRDTLLHACDPSRT